MEESIYRDARLLEQAFFKKQDAELIERMRRREAERTRKTALAEVSGITDDSVLDELVAHDIHAEALAAFSLVPILEVCWADGEVQPEERAIVLRAITEAGVQKDGIGYKFVEQWLERRPEPSLMDLWAKYTHALMKELPPEVGERIKQTVLKHARAVAQAAGGFWGFGRTSKREEEVLYSLEEALTARSEN